MIFKRFSNLAIAALTAEYASGAGVAISVGTWALVSEDILPMIDLKRAERATAQG
jgi:hypothetical protein